MHPATQARTPIQLGHLQLAVPMECFFFKQNSVKPVNFFPDEDGNILTIEQQTFPYSMLMDFGPALPHLDTSLDPDHPNLLDNSSDGSQSQPVHKTRLPMTKEQLSAVATCKSFTHPPVTTDSQPTPFHSSTVIGLQETPPATSTNVTISPSNHSTSSTASGRPSLGHLQCDLSTTNLQPVETSQPIVQLPTAQHTPSIPAPAVPAETQPQPTPTRTGPDNFDVEASRYTDPQPGVTDCSSELDAYSTRIPTHRIPSGWIPS